MIGEKQLGYLEFCKRFVRHQQIKSYKEMPFDFDQDGTLIYVRCSYASMIDSALNVAVALYKAGAPLNMGWPEMMLAAVEGTDEVRIRPNTFHDYIGQDCEGCGGTIEIPFEYEVEGSWWTVDILREFIKYAKWDKLEEVKPI